jgi:1-acyl-sn-glycerol-3-phosphate acyltransferase
MLDLYLTTMVLWAAAEALIWPIMPDALLVPLCVVFPHRAWQFWLAATLGSAIGGALAFGAARKGYAVNIRQMPLIREAMVQQADKWLAEEGPKGVRHQSLSALPFKVFALLAGERKLDFAPFIGWAMLMRGLRFAIVAALAAGGGLLFPNLVKTQGPLLLQIWTVLFLAGLFISVKHWEKRN